MNQETKNEFRELLAVALKNVATKGDLGGMASKSDLDKMATKQDLENLALMVKKGFDQTATKKELRTEIDQTKKELRAEIKKSELNLKDFIENI